MFLYLSAIPLLGSYMFYSIKVALEEHLLFLEKWYQVQLMVPDEDSHDDYLMNHDDWIEDSTTHKLMPVVTVRKFIFYQTEKIMSHNRELNYKCVITWELLNKHHINMVGKSLSETPYDYLHTLEKDFN